MISLAKAIRLGALGIALGGEDMSYLHATHLKYALPIRVRVRNHATPRMPMMLTAMPIRSM